MNTQKTFSKKKSAWFGLLVLSCVVAICCLVPNRNRVPLAPAEAVSDTVQTDVVYGEAGGQKLLLDIYGADAEVTAATVKRPAIIFVHGGSWSGGGKRDFRHVAGLLAKEGYIGFCVGYRLLKSPANRHPAQIDDVQRAVRWVRANAEKYGVDADNIGAFGGSAGGHLVALLGTTDTRDNSDAALANYSSRVKCVVDLYGPTDFTLALDERARLVPGSAKMLKTLEEFLGPLPEAKDNYIAASPLAQISEKTVPFLIFHGAKDTTVPVQQSQQFDAALRKAGIESKLVVFPDQGHGFVGSAQSQTFADSLSFFNRHLKTQAPVAE